MDNYLGYGENPNLNFRNSNLSTSGFNHSSVPIYRSSSVLNTPFGRGHSSAAPPLPPRPARTTFNNYNSYNSFSSPYNNYGYGGYSGFGSYGGYNFSGYRPYGMYNNYYNGSYPENRFIQMAEESSRPAFQSIQSILQAFSSVTMMFESSFHAIYSSYMSVLGVADNFSKLRATFGQFFSLFAVVKSFSWLFRKFLYMLGLSNENISKESVWSDALNEINFPSMEAENSTNSKGKAWSLLLFMSIIIGGPYLLFKLMNELIPKPVVQAWVPAQHPGSLAIGMYDFHAASAQELSFSAEQKLMIAPKNFQPNDCPGWILACNESRKVGLIPSNYIGVLMKSEKTGKTYIEHNGQTYESPFTNNPDKLMKKEINLNKFKEESNTETNEAQESQEPL